MTTPVVSTPDEPDRIGRAPEVEITTARVDGPPRPWVPIWVVRVDDALHARSWKGTAGHGFATPTAPGAV